MGTTAAQTNYESLVFRHPTGFSVSYAANETRGRMGTRADEEVVTHEM